MGQQLDMTLTQEQTQQLNMVITPALRQAIELLQLSTIELYEHIKDQATENPLIELEENEVDPFHAERYKRNIGSTQGTAQSLHWIEDTQRNMRDELIQQVNLQVNNPKEIALATYLIHNLDDNGYLALPESQPLTEEMITKGIALLQTIGPPGLGARSLQEHLVLQLKALPNHSQALQLVEQHFDLLTNRKWQAIAKEMDISLEEVKLLTDQIQQLQPKPQVDLAYEEAEYVIPDVVVEERSLGFSYYLHDHYMPKISCNREYINLRHEHPSMNSYITDRLNHLQWLQTSIAKRRETICKIVEYIIQTQPDFFRKGMQGLKPLTLQDVANDIRMHESTVSRATANKFIQTPVGLFDFKSLFSTSVDTVDGEFISQQKMKALLLAFIKTENKQKPFSDQKIAQHFSEKEGIVISRRTISKYRKELHIPSSRMRKEI